VPTSLTAFIGHENGSLSDRCTESVDHALSAGTNAFQGKATSSQGDDDILGLLSDEADLLSSGPKGLPPALPMAVLLAGIPQGQQQSSPAESSQPAAMLAAKPRIPPVPCTRKYDDWDEGNDSDDRSSTRNQELGAMTLVQDRTSAADDLLEFDGDSLLPDADAGVGEIDDAELSGLEDLEDVGQVINAGEQKTEPN